MTQWSTCQHFKIRQAAMPLQKEDLSTKEWAANGLGIEPFIKIYGNPHKDRKLIRGISFSYLFGHDYWTFNGVTMVSPLLIIHLFTAEQLQLVSRGPKSFCPVSADKPQRQAAQALSLEAWRVLMALARAKAALKTSTSWIILVARGNFRAGSNRPRIACNNMQNHHIALITSQLPASSCTHVANFLTSSC